MIDVMLVLLVIFMATAPLMTVGVPVNLPKSKGSQMPENDARPLVISIRKDGQIFLQKSQISSAEIVPKLKTISKNGHTGPIYIRGDEGASYGYMMKIMGLISAAGFQHLALITDKENG
jgi:biopolymer transport protein TolR